MNAASRSSAGTAKVPPGTASVTTPEAIIGPISDAAGTRRRPPSSAPSGASASVISQPFGVPSSGSGAGVRRATAVAGERDGHQQRREQHDDEHAQVLHERDEPVVGAELARHAHDPRRAAGHEPEGGGRRVDLGHPREQRRPRRGSWRGWRR